MDDGRRNAGHDDIIREGVRRKRVQKLNCTLSLKVHSSSVKLHWPAVVFAFVSVMSPHV